MLALKKYLLFDTEMGYLRDNHPRELQEILEVLNILADCGVRESREGYYISPEEREQVDAMPKLSRVTGVLENLLISLTDGAFEKYIRQGKTGKWPEEDLGVRNFIEERYPVEMQAIYNLLTDLHQGRYYEALAVKTTEAGTSHVPRGIPEIETIGKRVREQVIDLLYKIEDGKPGFAETEPG